MIKELSNKISVISKRLAAAVMASCCIISLCSCTFSPATESSIKASAARTRIDIRIHNKIKDLIGFDIDDEYIDSAESISDVYDKTALGKVKIVVQPGKETELQNYVEEKLGLFDNMSADSIPITLQHQYAVELRQMTSVKCVKTVKTGEDGISVTISVYMARMGANVFLYIF